MPPLNRTMTRNEWALLLVLSVLWGGSFFFTGVAVKELPPLTIVALRVGFAALILQALRWAMGEQIYGGGRVWMALLAMGFLNNVVPFCLIVWAQTHIASGLASILNATTPLFTVIVAHMATRDEKMTGRRLAGVLAGLLGVTVMVGPAALAGLGTDVLAQIAILTAALSYAAAGVFGRRFRAIGLAPMATATGQVTASALLLAPLALVTDRPWTFAAPSLPVWAALFGLASLSTALAYVIYFRILSTAGATNLLLVTFLIPVSAIIMGLLALGERLEPEHFIGMGLIGVGLAAIDGRILGAMRLRSLPGRELPP